MATSRGVIGYGVLKAVAMAVGLPLCVVVLMSIVGAFTDSGWARLGGALVVALGLPLLLADRLLPDGDPQAGRGIPTDVMAVFWLLVPLLAIGPAHGITGPWMFAEGMRLAEDGVPNLGAWTVALGSEPTEDEAPSEDASDEPSVDAGVATDAPPADAPTPDAGPPPEVADEDLSPAELFSTWSPSVVTIAISGSGGTGFVLDRMGTIATNQHVVRGATRIGVKFVDGTWADRVEVLMEDDDLDLALLRVQTRAALQPVLLGDSEAVRVGERAVSIGNPLGLEHTLTDGLVSARRMYRGRQMIQMSTPVSPGNSGGPLFNLRGQVVGVTTMVVGMGMAQNLNLAIPVDVLKEQIKEEYPDRRSAGGGPIDGLGTW